MWNEMSHLAQNEVIVTLFTSIVDAGLCAKKGRKPIADIQFVIERKFGFKIKKLARTLLRLHPLASAAEHPACQFFQLAMISKAFHVKPAQANELCQ